jgi:hypothetical protein
MTPSRGLRPRRRDGDPVLGGRFTVGEPVEFTRKAREQFPSRDNVTGVVVGASSDGQFVRVRSGSNVESYHPDYWQPEGTEE